MKSYVCITDMVYHIYTKSKELMKGTRYENDFFFYHDALSLMNAIDTKRWMADNGILKHWILPELGLNAERPRYAGHPIGNSPELMPLDCSLNKDLDDELWRHILYTRHLEEDDERKFSLSTPSRGSRAVKRVWKNSVTSKRIQQDVFKVLFSLELIREKNGTMVPNIGNHQGRRSLEAKAAKLNTRGGKRVRHVMRGGVTRWIHEDARVPRQQMVQLSLKRHRGEVDDEDDDSGAEN
jgi:hypothetical protein